MFCKALQQIQYRILYRSTSKSWSESGHQSSLTLATFRMLLPNSLTMRRQRQSSLMAAWRKLGTAKLATARTSNLNGRRCSEPYSLKPEQRRTLFRCRTSFVRMSLPSCPVQQGQIIDRRDRQETSVTSPSSLLIHTCTDRTRNSPQFHRSQMTSTIVARVSDAGLLS